MITRFVKLTIQIDKIEKFTSIYNEKNNNVRNFDGCSHLEIFKDIHDKRVFFTLSKWVSEEHLNMYRSSEIFKDIWSNFKPLFAAEAQAWSLG
jgi:quinol monooxygenase YgiN